MTISIELIDYERQCEATRQRFRTQLKLLPESCSKIALAAHRSRIKRARGRFSLSEMAPWILADILDAEPERVHPVAVAWLHMLLAVLMLDDFLDTGDKNSQRPEMLIVSELLMQRGVAILYRVAGAIGPELDQGFALTADAALAELAEHRGKARPYSPKGMKLVGQKLAMLQVCEAAVLSTVRNSPPAAEVRSIFNKLALGIQLLDDVTDLDEDWQVQNLTFPLAQTVRRGYLRVDEYTATIITADELLARVVRSGALEECLKAATVSIQAALEGLKKMSKDSKDFSQYLWFILRRIERLVQTVQEARLAWEGNGIPQEKNWKNWADLSRLNKLTHQIREVAQTS